MRASFLKAAGDFYAAVKIARQRSGLTLDENGLWVAATALALDATLVGRDGDFGRIDGLSVLALS
jgi:predicted nucleic acid-binding protein